VTEVNVGFEPQWILLKRTDDTQPWFLFDTLRGITADATRDAQYLSPNSSAVEAGIGLGVYDNGFRQAASVWGSGGNYIYIAIRRGPMKTPTSGTQVLTAKTRTGTGANTSVTSLGFSPDLVVTKTRTSGTQNNEAFWFDRLRGNYKYLLSANSDAEGGTTNGFALAGTQQETADIVQLSNINRSGDTAVDWFFRRAPGFFDVVAYTGTGAARTVSHNLGVVPEFIIVKRRSLTESWYCYSAALGNTRAIILNLTIASFLSNGAWNDTSPTSSVFTVKQENGVNGNGSTYIAYLFATCPGVSKVGSYTGTGTTLSVDCGFTNGARFVLIKRSDNSGDWYVWDTARGIIGGNDPYLLLNSDAAEVTNTDYIDPLSSGFQISSTAPVAINASGGTYIYLAIA
jgi:hypothetical protein